MYNYVGMKLSTLTYFARVVVSVGREQNAQSGLVIDRATALVTLASFQTVGEHQSARYRVEQIIRCGEYVSGYQLEADHVRIAVFQACAGAG